MKNLLLLLFAFPLFTGAQTATQFFYLKAKEDNAAGILIDSTVKVLNNRLSKQGYHNTSILYDNKTKQFVITTKDIIDTNYIKLWLIKPFKITFYELYTAPQITSIFTLNEFEKEVLDNARQLYVLLNIKPQDVNSPRYQSNFGVLQLKDTTRFNELKKALQPNLPADLVFALPRKLHSPKEAVLEIYALKNNKHKLEANDIIQEARVTKDGHYIEILIEFDEKGKQAFASMTEVNKGMAIAIVIDNRVCTAPFVHEKINGGKLQISGTFTNEEASGIVDMLSGGCIPLNLAFISQ